MAKQTINIGSAPDDGTGDPGRTAFDKVNDNFTELYAVDLTYILKDGSRDFTGSQNAQNILPVTDDAYHLGDSSYGWDYIQHPVTANYGTETARAAHHGGRSYGPKSDIFWGSDNVFTGFYSQRSMPVNETAVDGSTDYSSVYQGDSESPVLDLCYAVAGDIDGAIELSGATRVGVYDATIAKGGAGLAIHGRGADRNCYHFYDLVTTSRYNMLCNTAAKAIKITDEIGIGGDNIEAIIPIKHNSTLSTQSIENDAAIDLGKTTSQWKDGYFSGSLKAATYDPITTQAYTLNATAVPSRTLLASASATTINNNNVLAALITDLKALGLIT